MGGAGGGGGSGKVDYPENMRQILYNWIYGYESENLTDDIDHTVNETLNTMYSANPFTGIVAYDPDDAVTAALTPVTNFKTLVDALAYTTDYPGAFTTAASTITLDTASLDTITLDTTTEESASLDAATLDSIAIDNSRLTTDLENYSAILEDQIDDVMLPKFKAGMLNIGAVNTSGFTVGEAIIRSYKARDVAKYGTEMRVELEKLYDSLNSQFKLQRREIDAGHARRYREAIQAHKVNYRQLEAAHKTKYQDITAAHKAKYAELTALFKVDRRKNIQHAATQMLGELLKIREFNIQIADLTHKNKSLLIVAKKEELSEQAEYDEREGKYYLEAFQNAANVLASIGGGTAIPAAKKSNPATSAIAGGLTGAVSGAAIGAGYGSAGGYIGAAAGLIVGAGAGYLGAMQ